MSTRAIRIFPALAALLLILPAFAAKEAAGTNKTDFSVHAAITIGQTQLKPGDYTLQAVEGQNEVEILQHGKMIGKAACHWIQLPAKANASGVETDQGKVTEVTFRGNLQAVQID
jgi:hypothetical protein